MSRRRNILVSRLSVSSPEVVFPDSGGTAPFDIISNRKWEITNIDMSGNWLSANTMSGNEGKTVLILSADMNSQPSAREGLVTIETVGGKKEFVIDALQPGGASGPYLSAWTRQNVLDSSSQSLLFTISSNTQWSAGTQNESEWLYIPTKTGSGNLAQYISISANTAAFLRSETINISGTGVQGESINITQNWLPHSARVPIKVVLSNSPSYPSDIIFNVRVNLTQGDSAGENNFAVNSIDYESDGYLNFTVTGLNRVYVTMTISSLGGSYDVVTGHFSLKYGGNTIQIVSETGKTARAYIDYSYGAVLEVTTRPDFQ